MFILGIELLNLQMHVWDKYINIKSTLQSAMRVWLNLTMLNPSIAPDYNIMVYSVKFVTEEIIPAL